MIPQCSRADEKVYRRDHDFVGGRCSFCGNAQEVRADMLELWRQAVADSPSSHWVPPARMRRSPIPQAARKATRRRHVPVTGARLSPEVDRQIRDMLADGSGINRTARECGVSRQAVRRRLEDLD